MGYLQDIYKIFRGTTEGDDTGTGARDAAGGLNENADRINNALEEIDNASFKKAKVAQNLDAPTTDQVPSTQAVANRVNSIEGNSNAYTDNQLQSYQPLSEKGQPGGYAVYDQNSKVPAANTYGTMDEIIEGEYINATTFNDAQGNPVTPGVAKLYQDVTTGNPNSGVQYRWSGTQFSPIYASPGTTDEVPEGATNKYFTDNRVRATLLTGLSAVSSAAITAGDSILIALGKLQAQINSLSTSLGTKLDKGGYTGTAQTLYDFANTKESPAGALQKANTAESNAIAYTNANAIKGIKKSDGTLLAPDVNRVVTLPEITGATPDPVLTPTINSFIQGYVTGLTYRPRVDYTFPEEGNFNVTGEFTADPADATLDRTDVLVAVNNGTLYLKKGTPGAGAPAIDPETEIDVFSINIPAGATQPEGITQNAIYAENAGTPNEWNVTTASAAINLASTNTPISDTVNIEGTDVPQYNQINFTPANAILPENYFDEIAYRIKNKIAYTGGFQTHRLRVHGKKSNGASLIAYLPIPEDYGYDPTSTAIQEIILPFEVPSNMVSVDFVSVIVFIADFGFFLDDVRYTGGAANEVSGEFADKRLSNIVADLSEAEKTAIKNKLGVTEGGGSVSPTEKTGQTITFIAPANYNQTTPAVNTQITIDPTGAVKWTVIAYFVNATSEPPITGSTRLIKTGTFKANVLNVFWFTWMGSGYNLNIQATKDL